MFWPDHDSLLIYRNDATAAVVSQPGQEAGHDA